MGICYVDQSTTEKKGPLHVQIQLCLCLPPSYQLLFACMFQPPVNSGASSGTLEGKDMQQNVGGVVHPMGGASHPVGRVLQPPHLHPHLGSSPSQQYAVEEQITTVRIPMVRQRFSSRRLLRILQCFNQKLFEKLTRGILQGGKLRKA